MRQKFRDSVWDRHGVVQRLVKDVTLPKMVRVRQKLSDEVVENIPAVIRAEIMREPVASSIKPGMTVAITAGSRGVANLALILKETVSLIKELGAEPFIFPAMGSHGGGSAKGQREILESLGVTEEYLGVPIKASMDVVQIDTHPDGRPVYIDKYASEADGIIIVGRVKPHTAFRGKYESGLFKMLAIGVGKHEGAIACHSQGFRNMAKNVPLYAKSILKNANILFGLAIIENAHDETNRIVALTSDEIPEAEPALLEEARSKMACLYFDELDLLVVDEIGKNHSGDGMDPNITGSYCTDFASGPPNVEQYVVLDVAEESHGNAIGIGMAHFTTKRLYDQIDFDAGYPNALTGRNVLAVRVPMVLQNDRLALQAGLFVVTGNGVENPRVVRIANSSHVGEILVSESLLDEVKNNPNLEILSEAQEMQFDSEGNLIS